MNKYNTNNKNKVKIIITLMMMFIVASFVITVNAATLTMSSSKSTVEPGDSFTVTIKVSDGAGRINLSATNCKINGKTSYWLDEGSEKVTVTAGSSEGTATIKGTGVVADYDKMVDENKSSSVSVKVKKKEVVKHEVPETTAEEKTETVVVKKSKPEVKKEVKKEKKETKKEVKEEVVEEVKGEAPEEPKEVFIDNLAIKAYNKDNKEELILLEPDFKKDQYDYSVKLNKNIVKISLDKQAGDYTNNIIIKIEKINDDSFYLKAVLAVENQKEKEYRIKVIKEEPGQKVEVTNVSKIENSQINNEEEVKENKEENNKEEKSKKEKKRINMGIGSFIFMQILIILIELGFMYIILNHILTKKYKTNAKNKK